MEASAGGGAYLGPWGSGPTDAEKQQAAANAIPIDQNNPWFDPSNTQALAKNSTFMPDNYFAGNKQVAVDANNPSTWNTSGPAGWTTNKLNATPESASPSVMGGAPRNSLSGYPAMPNSYGLGQQQSQGAVPGAASNPNFNASSLSDAINDSGSKGLNPWSLQGEANARTGQP